MTNATDRPRLGLRNYAGYAAGDMVNSFAFALQAMFLLIYYTDAVGLAPVPVAGIIFGVRLWSAVSDLIAGRLIDVTRSRWGRFHPWLVGGSIPMLLTGVALFTVPRFGGTGHCSTSTSPRPTRCTASSSRSWSSPTARWPAR